MKNRHFLFSAKHVIINTCHIQQERCFYSFLTKNLLNGDYVMFFNKKLLLFFLAFTHFCGHALAMQTTNTLLSSPNNNNSQQKNITHFNVAIIHEKNSCYRFTGNTAMIKTLKDFLKHENPIFHILVQKRTLKDLLFFECDCTASLNDDYYPDQKEFFNMLIATWKIQDLPNTSFFILLPKNSFFHAFFSNETITFLNNQNPPTSKMISDKIIDFVNEAKKKQEEETSLPLAIKEIFEVLKGQYPITMYLNGHGTIAPEASIADLTPNEIKLFFQECEQSKKMHCLIINSCYTSMNTDLIPKTSFPLIIYGTGNHSTQRFKIEEKPCYFNHIFTHINEKFEDVDSYFDLFIAKKSSEKYIRNNIIQLLLPQNTKPLFPEKACYVLDNTVPVSNPIKPCLVIYCMHNVISQPITIQPFKKDIEEKRERKHTIINL